MNGRWSPAAAAALAPPSSSVSREGAHVALTYVSKPSQASETVTAARSLGVRAIAIRAYSADPEAVIAAVERTIAEFGGRSTHCFDPESQVKRRRWASIRK
jgi:hypothetical protein